MKIFAGWLLLFICVAFAAPTAQFSLSIQAENQVSFFHDDIVISATLTNVSDHLVLPDFGSNGLDYVVEMHDGTGSSVPDSALGRRMKSPDTIRISRIGAPMKPGATRSIGVNVSNLFDVPGPGIYSIRLTKSVGPEYDGGELASNVLIVTIVPRAPGLTPAAPARSGVVVAPPSIVSSGPASQHIKLAIEADETTVFAGRHIPITVRILNPPPSDLSLPSDIGFYYNLEARREGGQLAPALPAGRVRQEWHASDRIQTAQTGPAGGTYNGPVDVTKYFDMAEPGAYFVQAWIKIPEQFGGGELRSNVLTVTIKPK